MYIVNYNLSYAPMYNIQFTTICTILYIYIYRRCAQEEGDCTGRDLERPRHGQRPSTR